MSDETVIVAPHTGGDDATAALAAHNPAHAPTMDALVAPSRYARPYLSLVPRDAIIAAITEADLRIAPKGEMHKFPACQPGGKVLFRYIEADGTETAFSVDEARLTPRVRAAWWALAQLVEEEGRG